MQLNVFQILFTLAKETFSSNISATSFIEEGS